MLGCIKHGYYVRGGFIYFCRRCYKVLVGRLRITEHNCIAYLNLSFIANVTYPPNWGFQDICWFCATSRAPSP